MPQTPAFALLRDGKLVAPLVLGANAERLAAALSEAAASEAGKRIGEDPLENATEFEKQVVRFSCFSPPLPPLFTGFEVERPEETQKLTRCPPPLSLCLIPS